MVEDKQPSGSFGTPEDIGALANFLCTHNGRQMTGAAYTVDGGWTAQWLTSLSNSEIIKLYTITISTIITSEIIGSL